jgi:aldehyde dehydrogenase (NAD+)
MTGSTTTSERRELALIGGQWRAASEGATYDKHNPSRPSEVVATVPMLTEQDVEQAIAAAAAAFDSWAQLPPLTRAGYLERAATVVEGNVEQIATDITSETGKRIVESRGEVVRSAAILRWMAALAGAPIGEHFIGADGAEIVTARRPLGVIGVIAPWNFPLAIPMWKVAPALLAGNSVVLKPAFEAPLSGLHIGRAFVEAGLPEGVLSVVTGRGSSIGAAIVKDPRVRAISFTGSVPTGHWIREEATKAGKRVQLELGGQNPMIVMGDADLSRAVEAAFWGSFWTAGQKCTGMRRIYVHDAIYDEFRAQLVARVERATVGDPLDETTDVGPLASEGQFNDIVAAIEGAKSEGGTLLTGGPLEDRDGYYVAPALFEDVADDASLACDEVFGPVAALFRFGDFDDALRRANDVQFGLSASIYTQSLDTAERFQRKAEAGQIYVNSPTPGGTQFHVPFGGLKDSGFGMKELGRTAMDFFTDQVTTFVTVS